MQIMKDLDKETLIKQFESFIADMKTNRNFINGIIREELPIEKFQSVSFTNNNNVLNDTDNYPAGLAMLEADLEELRGLDLSPAQVQEWFLNKEYYCKVTAYYKLVGFTDIEIPALPANSGIN